MNRRNSTINDLARRLDLATSTVSRILNAQGRDIPFAKATIERVIAAAREMDYVPNAVAGNLRRGSTRLIALVLPCNTPELMDVIERTAAANGFGVLVQFTPSPDLALELRSLRTVLERQVDGLIWLPIKIDGDADYGSVTAPLRRMGKPVVLLETAIPQLPEVPVIDFDYLSAFAETLRHLALQGYRRVDFVHNAVRTPAEQLRGRHFQTQIQALGMTGDCLPVSASDKLVEEVLLRDGQPHDRAFLFETDWLGLRALQAARDLQIAVPQDIAICAIGDLLLGNTFRIGELTSPSMTMIRRPFGDMARRAVEILMAAIRQGPGAMGETHLPMALVRRQSTTRRRE